VKSVANAVNVLKCLSATTPELGVADVSGRLRLPKSTVSRLLGTLRNQGLLEQDPRTRRYRPGLLAFEIGAIYQAHRRALDVVQHAMAALVADTGHTGYLAVLDGRDIVVLRTQEGAYPVRLIITPGRRLPAYTTAIGKALLARLPDVEIRKLYPRSLRPMSARSLRTLGELLRALEQVRAQGWAPADEETFPGIRAAGVAFGPRDSRDLIGLSLSFPIAGLSAARQAGIVRSLLATARAAGRQLGDPLWTATETRTPST
jgi:DNA-binding IclR family transcriptional regulator